MYEGESSEQTTCKRFLQLPTEINRQGRLDNSRVNARSNMQNSLHRDGRVCLSELGRFIKGRGITRADLVDTGTPCLRYGEIYTTYGDVTDELTSFVSGDTAQRATPLHHGDIIFATSGETAEEIGKAVAWLGKDTAVAGSDTIILRDHGQDPVFLAHALNAHDAAKQKSRLGKGHSVVHIHEAELEKVAVYLLPRSQQRKIGKILRAWDEGVEKLEALRMVKLNHRKWLKLNLLTGRKRLPGFSREWCVARLNEILTEHRLQSTGFEEVYSVSVHQGLVNQKEHLGRSYASTNTALYNRVLPGDIVYTKSPTGEFPLGIIKQSKIRQEVIVSPLYGVFTPDTQELGVMLDAYFESPILTRNFLHPLVQKGAKNTIAITNSRFLEGKLCLPLDIDEQKAIAVALETSKHELTGIDTEIKMLTYQKRGLMQKLLTGKWRVTA